MRLARVLACLLFVAGLVAGPARAADTPRLADTPRRGVAILSSSIGHDVSADEIEAFVRECRIDFVVVDFAWITFHWSRTDRKAVDELARRLRAAGVVVAAMYRPRLLSASDAEVHVALDAKGKAAADHQDLCFAAKDSVEWGASWGEKILAECPSVDHLVLYNLRAPCKCAECKDGAGAKHADEFVAACRERWTKVRKDVRIGHVGNSLEFLDRLDFVCPFLPVNREDAGSAVDAEHLAASSLELREKAGGKPFVPLAKVCWESATTNTTDDVAAVIRACDAKQLGFVLWTYDWLFHSDDRRYDAAALVKALGGDPAKLARFFEKPAETARGDLDGRQWVYFDSRETATPPVLALVGGGHETLLTAEADTGLISYLADRVFGRLPTIAVSMADTNRVMVRFAVGKDASFDRAELRLTSHPGDFPPQAPFDVAVHAIDAAWEEHGASWTRAPAFAPEVAATFSVGPKDGDVRVDLTSLAREWSSGKRPNHGVLLKVARPVPEGTGPVAVRDRGADALKQAMARWKWATSPQAALEQVKKAKRPVLAVVVGAFDHEKAGPTEHDKILFGTVLSHPAVTELVGASFVPVRVPVNPNAMLAKGGGPDPLGVFGTNAFDAKAPALVVARADGRLVAVQPSMGTFDHVEVLRFLRDALADAGGPKAPAAETAAAALTRAEKSAKSGPSKVDRGLALMRLGRLPDAATALEEAVPEAGPRASEASYWLAAVLARTGAVAKANEILTRLARGPAEDAWTSKAAMRLAWPLRVGEHEVLVEAQAETKKPDAGRAALRAIDFLLGEQRPDGSWPVADADRVEYEQGVTTLAAHALLRWSDDLDASRKTRAADALKRADAWLDAHIARAPCADVNSFAQAYYLDYALDRLAAGHGTKDDVALAVRQVAGGLCKNGGWSYSKAFGDGWTGGFAGWEKTDQGRAHSLNTGLALGALARAKAAGFAVDDGVIATGVKALQSMRVKCGVYTYTWPVPRNFESDDASAARAPVCEQALLRLSKSTKAEMRETLDVFLKHRQDLHAAVKVSPSWMPPHAYSAYFFHFAYYHAASAFAELGDASSKRDLAALRDDLLGWAEPDGTWVDDLATGKCYGTASTLLVLKLAGASVRK